LISTRSPFSMHIEPSQKDLKIRLRKEIRQKRAAIDPVQRRSWDALINTHFEHHTSRGSPRVVAAYTAFDGEPDILPALVKLAQQGTRLALPVIQDSPGKAVITFREWVPDQEMELNRYGIPEPVGSDEVRITDMDLVMVPLVGWDRSGGRLGMGASFYDRLLQPFAELAKPERIGIAYELQKVPDIPREPWDIRLHSVITENGWFTCEG
jgi:5-formyltetrahydrofolate cyclo-ligase